MKQSTAIGIERHEIERITLLFGTNVKQAPKNLLDLFDKKLTINWGDL